MTFEAVLFDCDGVLVDSEPITNGVLCQMLNEAGWALSAQECMRIFLGKTVRSEAARIQAHTGRPLTDEWMAVFYERRNAKLKAQLKPIAGAVAAVQAVHSLLQGRIACASGADRFKVEMQLAQVGLAQYFEGRIFSGHEMPATKPAPDVYLAAAAALQVLPSRCLVLEDTVTGVTAGVAAGATVIGYSPSTQSHSSAVALRAAGAVDVLTSLADLPALLGD
ncbi:HAD family hydrolase [Giesbergeria anulus]|uniref:Haloacid dehalogenase superfamily, subfamily IA, variant 3 with third motif having DD or ED n=1 Tax=Giesbergeria anulus TaxID=180197 RepID=A0A1H9QTG2_9BURK|nr:HAD family phosphatase [Giesbergeria anulus]SER63738.1 haloacid dehalogenase superfamily, subfamily IA, variant 3 with third motif having DD or ED [Giesbergeria anulus]